MLVTASKDKTVAILDVKTGKMLYTGKTSDESNFSSIMNNKILIIFRYRHVCLLYLRKNQTSSSRQRNIEEANIDDDNQFFENYYREQALSYYTCLSLCILSL